MTTTKIKPKPYDPKPWDAGQTVTFDGDNSIGIVWSAGSKPGSAWVAMDGDTSTMVLVKKPTTRREAVQLHDDFPSSRVRFAEQVRRGNAWVRGPRDRHVHLDPACPRTATDSEAGLVPVTSETSMLIGGGYWTTTGREHIALAVIRGDIAICPRCADRTAGAR